MVKITLLHWVYVVMVGIILVTMILRKDTVIPCIVGIFLMGCVTHKNVFYATKGIFSSFIMAGMELLGIIMIISCIQAMSKLLEEIGANQLMVKPFLKIMNTPSACFWVIGLIMLLTSWFFWPSPATALIGAVFLPVAIRVGLPAIGVAMAINLFGHGLALSTDYVIQGAPTITATSAGVSAVSIMKEGSILFWIMGIVTIFTAFILLKKDIKKGRFKENLRYERVEDKKENFSSTAKFAAIFVPISFLIDIRVMFYFSLRGSDATALIGGTAILILVMLCILEYKKHALDKITQYIRSGFVFGMEIFGPIIPIAAFFYMGEVGPLENVLGKVLPIGSEGILSDMGRALASSVTMNKPIAACMEMVVGAITGLDGSGFSGMSLAGSLAKVFGIATHSSVAKLAALGQIGAIWIGGGTVVPWSLIPAAAICGILPIDLARRNCIPVLIGFIVTTIVAVFIL